MKIYAIYKKSDRSITGLIAEDSSHFEETSTHAISTNKVDWADPDKTFEDVKDTISSLLSVNSEGVLS